MKRAAVGGSNLGDPFISYISFFLPFRLSVNQCFLFFTASYTIHRNSEGGIKPLSRGKDGKEDTVKGREK